MQTEGLGIFAIAISIMFFMYILYAINKQPKQIKQAASIPEVNNIPQLFELITSPMVIRLLPNILSMIFTLLEKYHDKLEKKQSKKLQGEMQDLVEKLNAWHSAAAKSKDS